MQLSDTTIHYNETYQLFYLKAAISEMISLLSEQDKKIVTSNLIFGEDHLAGFNHINGVQLPVVFPLYLKEYIDSLPKNKTVDYNFIGVITPTRRSFLNKYLGTDAIILNSDRGRIASKKYTIDESYYAAISKSRFTLAPDAPGFDWTYRFFEAILCLSIPILEQGSNNKYCEEYFCYFDDDDPVYDSELAMSNYTKLVGSSHFLENVTLWSNLIKDNI